MNMNKYLVSGLFLNYAVLIVRILKISVPSLIYWIALIASIILMITGMVTLKK